MAQPRTPQDFSGLALITGGILLVALSIGGYYCGLLIDRRLGSAPVGAVIGLVVGTILGFLDLYRIASRIMRQQPVPTRAQQDAAQTQWERFEKSEDAERDRDVNHE